MVSPATDVFMFSESQHVITRKKSLLGPTSCFHHLRLSQAIYILLSVKQGQKERQAQKEVERAKERQKELKKEGGDKRKRNG